MVYSQVFTALAFLTLTGAASVPGAKVIKLPISREQVSTNTTQNLPLSKRSDPSLTLSNKQVLYKTTIKIGTPGQSVDVDVDTGSSDLWVDNKSFKPDSSSTWNDLGTPFSIEYGDHTGASGTFGTDSLNIGGAVIKNAQFAVATQSSAQTFILGVGFATDESTSQPNPNTHTVTPAYPNVPQLLKSQGYIDVTSYSLWLDDWTDAKGSILFGGVDHSKYKGTLGKLPIIPTYEPYTKEEAFRPNVPDRLVIALSDISLTNGDGQTGNVVTGASLPVLLDSGTTVTLLPKDWTDAIAAVTGATWYDSPGAYILPYGYQVDDSSINYNFKGVEINVPFSSFIRPVYLNNGGVVTWSDGTTALSLGVLPWQGDGVHLTDGTIYILGDTFLSGAYVVYDLDHFEIGLANAKTGNTGSENIEAIGSNGIPSATKAPQYSATSTNTHYTLSTPTNLF